jgi:hypothetical protein
MYYPTPPRTIQTDSVKSYASRRSFRPFSAPLDAVGEGLAAFVEP